MMSNYKLLIDMIINKRRIGNTSLEISELGMGTAPIGGWPIEVREDQAFINIQHFCNSPTSGLLVKTSNCCCSIALMILCPPSINNSKFSFSLLLKSSPFR